MQSRLILKIKFHRKKNTFILFTRVNVRELEKNQTLRLAETLSSDF